MKTDVNDLNVAMVKLLLITKNTRLQLYAK